MTDYFVDTVTGLSANNGLSWATAKNSVTTALSALPAGSHTVYCRGGVDTISAAFSTTSGSYDSVTIIGELDTYNFGAYSKYRWTFNTGSSGFYIQGRNVTLKQLYIDCIGTIADALGDNGYLIYVSGAAGKTYTIDRCFIHVPFTANRSTTTYPHAVRIRIPTTAKCVFTNNFIVLSGKSSSGNSHAVCIQNNTGGAGICGDVRVSGCYGETSKLTNNTASVPFGGFSGEGTPANSTIHDCIARAGTGYGYRYVGEGSANIGPGHTNAAAAFSSTTVSGATIDALFTSPSTFNYTPPDLDTAPSAVGGLGYNSSALTGISHDFRGIARVAPWDIGPHAYVQLSPYPDVHPVTDVSQAGDPDCIYNGQTPAIVVGDQISYKATTETNGWPVNIDAQGFPFINSSGVMGRDSFKFNIGRSNVWEPTDSVWSFAIGPTLSNPTDTNPTVGGATVTVQTNSSLGKLYLAARTAAQGGAYGANDQLAIRDGVVGTNCSYKAQITAPLVAPAVNTFIVTGLSPGVTYYYGMAQDIEAV